MYINKIDELLDKILDDFYNTVIVKNTRMSEILNEPNFVKYQKDINELMVKYITTIDLKEIKELVKKEEQVKNIVELVKRYIAYYLFLYIGFFFPAKNDTYVNNIVEFTRNQPGFGYKIDNFFNSENNANVIAYYTIIKNISVIINTENSKVASFSNKFEFRDAIDFLNSLGQEFVNANFKIKNTKEQAHNVIKTIILIELYKKIEKKDVYRILETVENETGEYIFIDIVIPKKKYIDFNSVESILTKREIINGLANEIWNYVVDSDQQITLYKDTVDDKIHKLIESGLIIPIVDDFLLYHKDTEKYDKTEDVSKIKKKEDTKIRYIVTKIDSTSDYYSDSTESNPTLKQNIKKNFYTPLLDRKAILVNSNEDLKIINKLLNQGRKSIENNEYFNDLINYKISPYVNFKEFEKYGFSIALNKTIDTVRSISFEKSGDHRQHGKTVLQTRVGAKDLIINVVGFMVPTNLKHLYCLKTNDVQDIRSLSSDKSSNGYDMILKYLKQTSIDNKSHDSSIYWMFDTEKDIVKMDSYEQNTKLTNQEQIKLMLNKLYNDVISNVHDVIIDSINKHENLTIQDAFQIIKNIEKRTLEIPRSHDLYNDIENIIYYNKSVQLEPKYDTREDIFYGIVGDIIDLPTAKQKEKPKIPIISINVHEADEYYRSEEIEEINAVCQHHISWENISNLRKTNPGKYTDLLYEFIQQYVVENYNGEYICKSCSTMLNIKSFITDGDYDNDTQRFIAYSMPFEAHLEDILEYSKFKGAIRSIDKLIDKIGNIANIPYYIGSTMAVKSRRKNVNKDVIDIVQINNQLLKKDFKERNIMATKQYGISRDLSNLFVFDLDNSIFIFSSKDKDYYKNIKHNNIIAYIIILMILEINESHISFMVGDKKGVCNFPIFEKYGHVLFEGIKIRTNKEGDLDDVKNYRVFCYMLYIISCMITKYNMWFFESDVKEDKNAKKKFNPLVQKMIIHTVIDVLNSIIENSVKDENSRIYEIISTKFFRRLVKIFNSEAILNKFSSNNNSSAAIDRKTHVLTKADPIILTGKYSDQKYPDPNYNPCAHPKYYISQRTSTMRKYHHINNSTNCLNGEWHNWKITGDNKFCKCTKCDQSMETLEVDNKLNSEITKGFEYSRLIVLAQKYCLNGVLHNFVFNDTKGVSICLKCGIEDGHKYSNTDLDKLSDNLANIKNKRVEINTETTEKDKVKTYNEKVLHKLSEQYKKEYNVNNKYKYIDDFINNIQHSLGAETNVGSEVYLRDNVYVINHDHHGVKLDKPIILMDKDNKIFVKSNHPIFNTDVIYYTSFKSGKIDVFYDANTLILLGYKETGKDVVFIKNPDLKIKINYSIANKLKYMGYEAKFININNKIEIAGELYSDKSVISKDDLVKETIKELIRNRIHNLKKIIYEFQRFFNRIINNYVKPDVKRDNTNDPKDKFFEEEEKNQIELLTLKYSKKLNNITLVDETKEHRVFKHWKAIEANIYADSMDDITINIDAESKLLNVEDINNYDNNGNILLFYIVSEMNKLLTYNTNKLVKANITNFYLDFINTLFDMFNEEIRVNNFDIRKFIFTLKSGFYMADFEAEFKGETTGIYEEYVDPDAKESDEQKELNDDDREEAEALDIDLEPGDEMEIGDNGNYESRYRLAYEDNDFVAEREPARPSAYDGVELIG